MSDPQASRRSLLPWSFGRVAGCTLLIATAFVVVSILLSALTVTMITINDPAFDPEHPVAQLAPMGLQVWISAIGTTLVCVPLVLYLTSRFERWPARFIFGLPTTWRAVVICCLAILVFALASDLLTLLLGRPLVPPFMTELYGSAHPVALLLALVVAAPVFEEVFFRGFVLGGFVSSGMSARAAAVVSALTWAAVHLQYDLYGVATIFAMGLLLAWARMTTRSLLPCVVMHGLANLFGFAQAAWSAGQAGT